MATWHQQQALKRKGARLYHDTLWTIVNDPPNECMCTTLCRSKAEAEETLARWKANNPNAHLHCYILPPYKKD